MESQDYVGRVDLLASTDARTKFVSAEPLLGPVEFDVTEVDWVIVGGESGPRARPMKPGWVRAIRDACGTHDTPFFFKQWGGRNKKAAGRLLDNRTWDQFPNAAAQAELPLSA